MKRNSMFTAVLNHKLHCFGRRRSSGVHGAKKFNVPLARGFFGVFFLLTLIIFFLFLQIPGVLAGVGDLAKGKALYEKHCAACHGPEGKGDGYTLFDPPVADLTTAEIQKRSDAALLQSVHKGIPNTAMGTWTLTLSDEEITLVLGYVRSLAP